MLPTKLPEPIVSCFLASFLHCRSQNNGVRERSGIIETTVHNLAQQDINGATISIPLVFHYVLFYASISSPLFLAHLTNQPNGTELSDEHDDLLSVLPLSLHKIDATLTEHCFYR